MIPQEGGFVKVASAMAVVLTKGPVWYKIILFFGRGEIPHWQ
jgi:hypothetical protein